MGRLVETNPCHVIAMDCNPIELTEDRDPSICCKPLVREFPTPSRFDELHLEDKSQLDTCSEAPWFCRDAVEVAWLYARYTDEDGWLPCCVPLRVLCTFAWLQCFYF